MRNRNRRVEKGCIRFWSLEKKKKKQLWCKVLLNKQNFYLNININDYNLLTEMVVCGRGCLR